MHTIGADPDEVEASDAVEETFNFALLVLAARVSRVYEVAVRLVLIVVRQVGWLE